MPHHNFINYFNRIYPISAGLSAYLEICIQTFQLERSARMPAEYLDIFSLIFLDSGTVKQVIHDIRDDDKQTIQFCFKESLLNPIQSIHNQKTVTYTTAIENSHLQGLSNAHHKNMYKLFPEYRAVVQLIHSNQLSVMLYSLHLQQYYTAKQRYHLLFSEHPELFKIATIKDIAAALGINADTLSRLRSNK